MKIRCNFIYVVKEKDKFRDLTTYESYKKATHFELRIYSLEQEMSESMGYYSLTWEEKELLKSSGPIEIKEGDKTQYYIHFHNFSWIYFTETGQIYINSTDVEV